MATIDTLAVDLHCGPDELWAQLATAVRDWLARRSIPAADACLLVPFAELLAPARRAFAQTPGWLPRIHTTRTLTRECAPRQPADANASGPNGDPALDELIATRLLRQQVWADAWARRDRPAFDHAVARLVRTAHLLMHGAAASPPERRPAFWERVRATAGGPGPGAADRALVRTAIEWAAAADDPASDRLFELHRTTWIVVECGGEDALSNSLLSMALAAGRPGLRVRIDAAEHEDPFAALPQGGSVDLVHADDAEEEAGAAALEVVDALACGATPVALIAEDRSLVRRVRALLERAGITIDDESGWSLATTRAGAHAFAALRAAHPAAGPDDWLDWWKSRAAPGDEQTLASLEAAWRGGSFAAASDQAQTRAWWARERDRLAAFALPGQRTLAQWLPAFEALLFDADADADADAASAGRADPAMIQLRAALRLDDREHDAVQSSVFGQALTFDEFSGWVDRCLEGARFVPPRDETPAQVILTPLSRAIARPFQTVVLPGSDERRLGTSGPRDLLLSDAQLHALDLPDRHRQLRRQALAFVQLLRVPRLVMIRRRADGDEMLAPSPLVDRLLLRRGAGTGHPVRERSAALPRRTVQVRVPERPLPVVGGRLPRSWSASAVEALRQCPYRFFVRHVLRLREQEELDDDVDKREYGRWLHATLEQFHIARAVPGSNEQDIELLTQISQQVMHRMVDAGEFSESSLLPYRADFAAFAARYVAWLHEHDAQGWRFIEGEAARQLDAADINGLRLHGRIDRIDRHPGDNAVRLIDYKTSARANLTKRIAQPLEDTQLAVYAALMLGELRPGASLSAVYLSLDDAVAVSEVEHAGVAGSARCLLEALAAERARIDAGAPLPALGQGSVCETCEARGLCRRDHWTAGPSEAA